MTDEEVTEYDRDFLEALQTETDNRDPFEDTSGHVLCRFCRRMAKTPALARIAGWDQVEPSPSGKNYSRGVCWMCIGAKE